MSERETPMTDALALKVFIGSTATKRMTEHARRLEKMCAEFEEACKCAYGWCDQDSKAHVHIAESLALYAAMKKELR